MSLTINSTQNRQLHDLLGEKKLNWMDQKANLVHAYTDGRTASSKEMTMREADQLIKYLQGQWDSRRPAGKKYPQEQPQVSESTLRQRRTIISLTYDLGWTYEFRGRKLADLKRLDKFLVNNGTVQKKVLQMDDAELSKTITQLRSMIGHNGKTAFNKDFKQIRKDLNV